jgi:type I restriction enzyme S subunit
MRKGWIETKLGEVAEWGSGGTPKAGFREYYDGDIPWCVIGDLTENAVWHTEKMITELGLDNSSAKLIRSGSVLLAMYGASIGRTGISGVPMATNQAIASAIVHERILDAKYLLYFLQTQKSRFVESGQGAAQPNISQGIIKSWPINLPPLRAQKRIVDLISSVDSYVEALRQQADSARRSRNAILNEMLTAGVDGWQEYE